jgi:hypothetical protein
MELYHVMWPTYTWLLSMVVDLTTVALMAGKAAFRAEEESDESLVDEMMLLLSRIYQKTPLPPPVQVIISRWGGDPFARGSYSFIGRTATGEDYDLLGESVESLLYFAGEATCRTHPATVHGAYISGLRAAAEVLERFVGKIPMPSKDEMLIPKKNEAIRNPLIERSTTRVVRPRTDPESYRYRVRKIKEARYQELVRVCTAKIAEKLGSKPVPPKKYHRNAFLLFQRDKWDEAKVGANRAKTLVGDGGPASRDEVRAWMGKMWRDLPEDKKRWYTERVDEEKMHYGREMATYASRLGVWEQGVQEIKGEIITFQSDCLSDEEKHLLDAAREEEHAEGLAKHEKEHLRRFFDDIGVDPCLSSDDEGDYTRVRTSDWRAKT